MEEGEGGERHCHNKSLLFKVGCLPFFLPMTGVELGFPAGPVNPFICVSLQGPYRQVLHCGIIFQKYRILKIICQDVVYLCKMFKFLLLHSL